MLLDRKARGEHTTLGNAKQVGMAREIVRLQRLRERL